MSTLSTSSVAAIANTPSANVSSRAMLIARGGRRARPSAPAGACAVSPAPAAHRGRTPRARRRRAGSSAAGPPPPSSTSWCATSPGQAHRVDRHVARDQVRGRASRPRRCVLLRLVVQLDDLGARQECGRLGGEAHHQHGADREVRREEHRQALLAPARAPVRDRRRSSRSRTGRPRRARRGRWRRRRRAR